MLASDMQANFQFCGSRVLSFSLNNEFVTLSEALLPRDVDVSCDIYSVDRQDEFVAVVVRLKVAAHCRGEAAEDGHQIDLDAKLLIEGCSAAPGNMGDEELAKYAIINGGAVLYSMARSFISTTTSLSTTSGKLTLPMVSTFALYREYQEKQASKQKRN